MMSNFVEGHSVDKVECRNEPCRGGFFGKNSFDQASAIDLFNDVIVEVRDT